MAGAITATLYPAEGRAQVTITGWTGMTYCTVKRYAADGTPYAVRGAEPTTLSGGAWAGDDFETPLDQSFYYSATSNTGAVITSGSFTVASDGVSWLKNPGKPPLNVQVRLSGTPELTRPARQAILDVVGRRCPVAIAGVRGSRRGTIQFATLTPADLAAIDQLLEDGQPLLLQTPSSYGLGNLYVAAGDLKESRVSRLLGLPQRIWSLDVTEVDRPDGVSQAVSNSFSAAQSYYTTFTNMATKTFMEVLQGVNSMSGANITIDAPTYSGGTSL